MADELNEQVLARIDQIRQDLGMRQSDIADRSGGVLARSMISKIRTGSQRLTVDHVVAFAAAFGVSVQYLMFGTGGETHLIVAQTPAERDLLVAARSGDMVVAVRHLADICEQSRPKVYRVGESTKRGHCVALTNGVARVRERLFKFHRAAHQSRPRPRISRRRPNR